MIRRRLLLVASAIAAVAAASPVEAQSGQRTLYASGSWAALQSADRATCQALARSLRDAAKGVEQTKGGFAFDRAGPRRGELHFRLSRAVRDGSSVMLTIGARPFLLVARGATAWSSGPAQEAAIIAAIRAAGGMRVEGRASSGRRFVDRYLLDGAPGAIDAAAAGCAPRRW